MICEDGNRYNLHENLNIMSIIAFHLIYINKRENCYVSILFILCEIQSNYIDFDPDLKYYTIQKINTAYFDG